MPLVSCGKFLGILGVPAASLQRGNNRAEVTGSSSSRKKRLSVSVTSSTKCSPGRSFTERASRRNSARSRRLRARAPPFRYMPSSWSPENSQHLCLPLPKDPTTHPLSLTAPPRQCYMAIGVRAPGRRKSASRVLILKTLPKSSSESPSPTMKLHTASDTLSPHYFEFEIALSNDITVDPSLFTNSML